MVDYIVRPGDTIYSIARLFGITTTYLRSLNPQLDGIDTLLAGQTLRVPAVDLTRRVIEVDGYTYPDINAQVLQNILPYLTYLSILRYRVNPDGSLSGVNDVPLIQAARRAQVAPMMVITNFEEAGGFSSDLAHVILTDVQLQQTIINNVVSVLKSKNYYGLNVDFEYIYPVDFNAYTRFLQMITLSLHLLGYIVTVTINVQLFLEQQELFNEARSLSDYGRIVDRFIVSTNDLVCAYEASAGVASIDEVQRALDYASTLFLSLKILLSIPNCCLDWQLPNPQEANVQLLSPVQAEALAARMNAAIQFEPQSQASYFSYTDGIGAEHVVWCGNEGNTRLPLILVDTYNLGGVSLRTINHFSMASYQVLSTMYEIRKVIEI